MSDVARLRVALDLSGPHEPLGNWMQLLADALSDGDLASVVRFRTEKWNVGAVDDRLFTAPLWRPWWHRSRGRSIDRLLEPVDVVHVSGLSTPPTKSTPLVISVDDLRPLRDDAKGRQRVTQLQRAVKNGAQLVATSRSASLEVQRTLELDREHVVIVAPAVRWDHGVVDGENLVVNVTGRTDEFLHLAQPLVELARRRGARVVVLASHEAAHRIRRTGVDVDVAPRRQAADVLNRARTVVHLSDGARFPSFAVAALAAGVPTCSTPTEVNRELLEGATVLTDERDEDTFVSAVEDLWENEARRSLLAAAGRDRASDFSPAVAAREFAELYSDLVRRRART